MAKWYGSIGFSVTEETAPGVYTEKIKEKQYIGEITRAFSRRQNASTLNDDISITNQISIIADPFMNENFHSIRFVTLMGTRWKVNSVSVEFPRLILDIGGVYNGPEA